jgi:hypothetical protein
MSIFSTFCGASYPRRQAERIVRLVTQDGSAFHGAVLGMRREGKTDLLRQIHARLFEQAEGPIPFFYTFQTGRKDDALAQHLFAAFCLQVRAFLMRQEDFVWEPPASLERELEKPGLPLALTEMAHAFLALPPAQQLDFAVTLAARFAHREDRPLCLLLDDIDLLEAAPRFLPMLDSAKMCWLLAGRYPFLSRNAGKAAWPLVRVEPFSGEEALMQARKLCLAAGLQFSRQVWERWCEMFGASMWLLDSLITAAAVRDQPLDSIEQLGRLYVQELASGTLGTWLSVRLEQAVPDRSDRARVGGFLDGIVKTGMSTLSSSSLPPPVWDGLVEEEWAEESVEGPRIHLDAIQRDWLSLMTVPAGASSERAKSRLLQTFLLRAEQGRDRPESARFSTVIRQRLLDLPRSGFPDSFSCEGQEIHPPKIFSVCTETAVTAELFWCYGFDAENREAPDSPVVLLIAVCDDPPTDGQLQKWQRQLESEVRLILPPEGDRPAARRGPGPIQHLWVAVPPGTSLTPTTSELRFSWQTFFRLVVQAEASDHNPPPAMGD